MDKELLLKDGLLWIALGLVPVGTNLALSNKWIGVALLGIAVLALLGRTFLKARHTK